MTREWCGGKCTAFQQLYFSHINDICFILQASRKNKKIKKNVWTPWSLSTNQLTGHTSVNCENAGTQTALCWLNTFTELLCSPASHPCKNEEFPSERNEPHALFARVESAVSSSMKRSSSVGQLQPPFITAEETSWIHKADRSQTLPTVRCSSDAYLVSSRYSLVSIKRVKLHLVRVLWTVYVLFLSILNKPNELNMARSPPEAV